jgi:hypothetical protein
MNAPAKIALRVLATLFAAAAAFCVGFYVTGAASQHWDVPRLIKEAPHDGQIGLAGFVVSLYGACASAIVVLAFGIRWIVNTTRGPQKRPV